MTNDHTNFKWVFMGTPQIAVDFLSSLQHEHTMQPDLIVTNPDRPVGRKQVMTPPPVKEYALANGITYIQTDNLDDILDDLSGYDVFCVFAFSKLLKQHHLDLPRHGAVNLHPSLLPQYRGASPITAAIINDTKDTGITLMKLERGMDSGPIIAQTSVHFDSWGPYPLHEQLFATYGAELFAANIEGYLNNAITPEKQNHEQATYCAKFTKSDMELTKDMDEYEQYRRYCAFPKPFFINNNKRYIISDAVFDYANNKFVINRVIPEGKNERDFSPTDWS